MNDSRHDSPYDSSHDSSHDSPHDSSEAANEPRWLRLASALRAEADPVTLAHVRARLASRLYEPTWLRWLSRPAALATSAALLVVSAFTGSALLSASEASAEDETLVVSTMLGDDGSYGLPVEAGAAAGTASSDSEGARP